MFDVAAESHASLSNRQFRSEFTDSQIPKAMYMDVLRCLLAAPFLIITPHGLSVGVHLLCQTACAGGGGYACEIHCMRMDRSPRGSTWWAR